MQTKLLEYGVEAVVVSWLGYLFLYQNYLLYNWHRGLPLPSRWPFLIGGVVMGALFFLNGLRKEKIRAQSGESPQEPPGSA